jgi:hypothetical protein
MRKHTDTAQLLKRVRKIRNKVQYIIKLITNIKLKFKTQYT